MRNHPFPDHGCLHLAELKGQRGRDVMLLAAGLADEELPRLAIVVSETFRAQPAFRALFDIGKWREAAVRGFPGTLAERVRLVIHVPDRITHSHMPILLEMVKRAFRRVDGNVREIRAAQTLELGIEIREVAALQ